MFLGIGWWFITGYFILRDHGGCIIDLVLFGVVACVWHLGSYHIFIKLVLPSVIGGLDTLHVWMRSLWSWAAVHKFSLPSVCYHRLPAPSATFLRWNFASFLRWLHQQFLVGCLIVVCPFILPPSWFPFLAPYVITLPVFFIITNVPPPIASPMVSSPSFSAALLTWGLSPALLLLLLNLWLGLLQSLLLPGWLLSALSIGGSFLSVGILFFVIGMWSVYGFGLLLDSRHVKHPHVVSVIADAYNGQWLLPAPRRTRRNGLPPSHRVTCSSPLAPSGWFLRHCVFAACFSVISATLVPSPVNDTSSFNSKFSPKPLCGPAWPPPSYNHLLDASSALPYKLPSVGDSAYDIDSDADAVSLDGFSVVEDASDQYAADLILFTDDVLSLHDAGYRFFFEFTPTTTIPFSSRLSRHWLRHYKRMRSLQDKISQLEEAAKPLPWSNLVQQFLAPFCPATAAQVLTARWMYSFTGEAVVGVDLSRRFSHAYPTYLYNVKFAHVPLIVDTGASVCISPAKSDFVPGSYKESNMQVRDLSGSNKVVGEGLLRWAVKDTSGETRVIEVFGIHIPTAGVRLLSPQVLRRTHGIGGSIEDDGVLLSDKSPDVSIFARLNPTSNLPTLSLEEMPRTSSVWGDSFLDLSSSTSAPITSLSTHLNVLDPSNRNLSPGEKELLLWHHRLSHTNLTKV